MTSIIKVDRIATPDEARAFVAAGANLLGISFGRDPRTQDGRVLSASQAGEIRTAVPQTRFSIELDAAATDPALALEAALALRPDFLQVPLYGLARRGWMDLVLQTGAPIILDGETASYEDPPNWIASALDDGKEWKPQWTQLRLLEDMSGPWSFLTTQAPQEPDERLQLEEIQSLTERYPLLLTMEVTAGEAAAFCAAFPRALGFFFRLAGDVTAPALEIIRAISEAPNEAAVLGR